MAEALGRAPTKALRTRAAILDHTYYGRVVGRCRVGGRDFGETALNAAVCGTHGVPVVLVTGDTTACNQAKDVLGDIETVPVKEPISRYAARCVAPAVARDKIREAARRAVDRARGGGIKPFRPVPPHRLEVDFVNSACADAAELVPGTVRIAGLTVAYAAPDPATMIRVMQAWTILAASTLV